MFKRIKEIIQLLKVLYIKIAIMCKSDCQIGRDENGNKMPSPSGDDNHVDELVTIYQALDNNHVDEQRGVTTSTI